MIQSWLMINNSAPAEIYMAHDILPTSGSYGHTVFKSNKLDIIFKCKLQLGGYLKIFINKNEAEAGVTPPHYVARAFLNNKINSYLLSNAAEITQTAGQAQEIVIKWSGTNYAARFNYNTDWAPKLTQFATFRVKYSSITSVYNCTSSGIDIPQVPTWKSIHRSDNISNFFSIWSLSDFGLAARLPDDSE